MNPTSFTFTFSAQHVDQIYAALAKQPYGEVEQLMRVIQIEVGQQQAKAAQAAHAEAVVQKAADSVASDAAPAPTPEPPAALIAAAANGAHPPKSRAERRKAKANGVATA